MRRRPLLLGLQLGSFQLGLGIFGVLAFGLFNRLLIEDIHLPAVLVAVAIGSQQLMGFTRVWFGHRSDRIPSSRLKRTPFILSSSVALALLFGVACRLVLQLGRVVEGSAGATQASLLLMLTAVFVAIGTAIAAGGTALAALIADRTTTEERPKVLSVVWGMRLVGVLFGSVLVNQMFGDACAAGASTRDVLAGLERLAVVTPPLLLGLGVVSVLGVERRGTGSTEKPAGDVTQESQRLTLAQLLIRLRSIPEAGRFLGVLCLFTFSMFLNDAVLEPYGAAVFGMGVCATTSLNVLLALGFFGGLALSGFVLIQRFGTIRVARYGAVLASSALALMLLAGADGSIPLLQVAVALFGLSLGVCINACLTLMFSFVQSERTGFLLGIWGAGYAYASGLATIAGGGLLTLFKSFNGGDAFGAYGGVFGLQMICFFGAAWISGRLDVAGFRSKVRNRLCPVMEMTID